jgi:hypothetical protein
MESILFVRRRRGFGSVVKLKFKLIHDQQPPTPASKNENPTIQDPSQDAKDLLSSFKTETRSRRPFLPQPEFLGYSVGPVVLVVSSPSLSHIWWKMNSRLSLVMTRDVGTLRFRSRRRATASLKADCECKPPAERYESYSYDECSTKNQLCAIFFV